MKKIISVSLMIVLLIMSVDVPAFADEKPKDCMSEWIDDNSDEYLSEDYDKVIGDRGLNDVEESYNVSSEAESNEEEGNGDHGIGNPYKHATKTVTYRVYHIDGYSLSTPYETKKATVWDCVWFGSYWQDDTNNDGTADTGDSKKPIKWRVLSVDGDDAFIMADMGLDAQPYNIEDTSITWKECSLRTWLNDVFYDDAFNSQEKSAIISTSVVNDDNLYYEIEGGENSEDNVFLLSIAEYLNADYGFDSTDSGPYYNSYDPGRRVKPTAFAKERGAFIIETSGEYAGLCRSWLRSPGRYTDYAAIVDNGGLVYKDGSDVFNAGGCVRPVLHLNLSSSCWSPAGTVCSDGTFDETAATGQGGGSQIDDNKLIGCPDFKIGRDTFKFDMDPNNNRADHWNWDMYYHDILNNRNVCKLSEMPKLVFWQKVAAFYGGWCYGASALMGLFAKGIYNTEEFGAQNVSEIGHDEKIDKLLTYYFMLQFLDSVRSKSCDDNLGEKLISRLRMGEPCILNFDTTEKSGHSILAYAFDETSDEEYYYVYVADPSCLCFTTVKDGGKMVQYYAEEPGIIKFRKSDFGCEANGLVMYTPAGGLSALSHLKGVISVLSLLDINRNVSSRVGITTNIKYNIYTSDDGVVTVDGPYYGAFGDDNKTLADYYIDDLSDAYKVINSDKDEGVFIIRFPDVDEFRSVDSDAEEMRFFKNGGLSIKGATGESVLESSIGKGDSESERKTVSVKTTAQDLAMDINGSDVKLSSESNIGTIEVKVDDQDYEKMVINSNAAEFSVKDKSVGTEIKDDKENGDGMITKAIASSGYKVKYTSAVSFNGVKHIQKGGKASKSKCADVDVTLYGPDGKVIDPGMYKLTFKNNKDAYGSKKPYFTIKLKGKVEKDIQRAFKDTMERLFPDS